MALVACGGSTKIEEIDGQTFTEAVKDVETADVTKLEATIEISEVIQISVDGKKVDVVNFETPRYSAKYSATIKWAYGDARYTTQDEIDEVFEDEIETFELEERLFTDTIASALAVFEEIEDSKIANFVKQGDLYGAETLVYNEGNDGFMGEYPCNWEESNYRLSLCSLDNGLLSVFEGRDIEKRTFAEKITIEGVTLKEIEYDYHFTAKVKSWDLKSDVHVKSGS